MEHLMSRTSTVSHGGRQVVIFDFTSLSNPQESLQHIAEAKEFVRRLPADGSGLFLTDVIGSRYNMEVLQALKEFAAHNKPYASRGAVATNSGLHRVAIMAVAAFSGRELKGFPSRQEALDWLVSGREGREDAAA
jgi:hypothetical protein